MLSRDSKGDLIWSEFAAQHPLAKCGQFDHGYTACTAPWLYSVRFDKTDLRYQAFNSVGYVAMSDSRASDTPYLEIGKCSRISN